MKFSEFKEIIDSYQKTMQKFSELHDIGFDFYEGKYKLVDSFSDMFNFSLKSHYNKFGLDWIDWFIFENDYGNGNLSASDENGNKICDTLESLYNYIENNHKLNDIK